MFDDLITESAPTEKRLKGLSGPVEQRLSEGAVILAYGLHLLRTQRGVVRVELHPDGEHGKRFDMRRWLEKRGFRLVQATGKTSYGGEYVSDYGQQIILHPASGIGDVVAESADGKIIAECKGGIINTRHPGPTSSLRRGLCEAIGLLMSLPTSDGDTQIAVVPKVPVTEKLAKKLAFRARLAGVRIALVDERGNVFDVE